MRFFIMRIFERNIRLIREINVIFGKPDIIRHLGHTVELFTVVGIFFMYFVSQFRMQNRVFIAVFSDIRILHLFYIIKIRIVVFFKFCIFCRFFYFGDLKNIFIISIIDIVIFAVFF